MSWSLHNVINSTRKRSIRTCIYISFVHAGVVDLCPLYNVLLDEVCSEFNEEHIVAHHSGHWLLCKLLEATDDEEMTPLPSGILLIARFVRT